tara:strand:- start:687 stop:830 length:144 start_codon:yes stop_codon:yes gene_type:complete
MNKKTEKVINLIVNLGWDYERMTTSGQKTYDKICNLLNIQEPTEGEE